MQRIRRSDPTRHTTRQRIAQLALLLASTTLSCVAAQADVCPPAKSLEALGFPQHFRAGASSTDFSAIRAEGVRGLRARSAGDGTLAMGRSLRAGNDSVDLRDQFLRFRIRLSGEGRIGGMELRVGSGESGDDFYAFPFTSFSDARFDPLQAGPWLDLTLSFGSATVHGKPDRSALRWVGWLLRDDGTAPVVVELTEIEAVPSPPEGALSLTFDDGYVEHASVAARLMREHGFPGTAYVMPEQVDTKSYVTGAQLDRMQQDGWDIAAHHVVPLTDWSDEALRVDLPKVRHWLDEHGYAKASGHLAYPLGRHDVARVLPATRHVFETARIAGAGPETLPPADRYRLRALNVIGGVTTPQDIGAMARAAKRERHWAILMLHRLVPGTPTDALEYRVEDFARALEEIRASGVPVRPVSEVAAQWQCAASAVAKASR